MYFSLIDTETESQRRQTTYAWPAAQLELCHLIQICLN